MQIAIRNIFISDIFRHGRGHHLYPTNINFCANLWALKAEGCTCVIATNACGSLREEIPPGHVVICDQFLDWWVDFLPIKFISFVQHLSGSIHRNTLSFYCITYTICYRNSCTVEAILHEVSVSKWFLQLRGVLCTDWRNSYSTRLNWGKRSQG